MTVHSDADLEDAGAVREEARRDSPGKGKEQACPESRRSPTM